MQSCLNYCIELNYSIYLHHTNIKRILPYMSTTIIIILLSAAIVLLVLLIPVFLWRIFRQSDELREKNDVIVREVRRNNQTSFPLKNQSDTKRKTIICPKCGRVTSFNMQSDAIDEQGEFYRCQHCGCPFHYT